MYFELSYYPYLTQARSCQVKQFLYYARVPILYNHILKYTKNNICETLYSLYTTQISYNIF